MGKKGEGRGGGREEGDLGRGYIWKREREESEIYVSMCSQWVPLEINEKIVWQVLVCSYIMYVCT